MTRTASNQPTLFSNEPPTATAAADRQTREPAAMSRDMNRRKANQVGPGARDFAGDGRGDRRQPASHPERSQKAEKECGWCHHRWWWLSIYGVLVCGNCHPPAVPGLAVEWIGDPWPKDGLKPNPSEPRPVERRWPYVL
ncbi:MAG: hypothetical protein GXY83_00505 [Rhodopirellula sp.]|nr:hypothetical protein [Rhodopirellula sp.]